MTGLATVFQDDPSYSTVSTVKNPELQTRLDAQLGEYDKVKGASSLALDDFIKKYLAGTKDAESRAGQEGDVISGYYNGSVESQLAGLRAKRAAATRDAVTRALAGATRNQNLSRVGADGGGSSYDRQIAAKTATDIELQNALEQTAMERGDWDYLQKSKLGMIGQRQAIADTLAGRALVPANMQKAELGWNFGALNDLMSLDQKNKFYGVQQDQDMLDKLIAGADKDMNTITNLISSIRGGGGGGGGNQQMSTSPTANWGGYNSGGNAMAESFNNYSAAGGDMTNYGTWGMDSSGF